MFSNLTSNIKTIVEEAKNDQLKVEKAIKQMQNIEKFDRE